MLLFFLTGAAIGIITGMPIGPANVAVIDTAYRHAFRRAIAVGAGAAIADGGYALVGILGLGPILEDNPSVPPILWAVSGVVLVAYGLITTLAKPDEADKEGKVKTRARNPSRDLFSGFILGVAIILLNPAALVTWVLIVGSYIGSVTTGQGVAVVIGVTCGSFCWFCFVAYLAHKGKKMLGEKAFWITRIVGVLLIGYGGWLVYKAANYWL